MYLSKLPCWKHLDEAYRWFVVGFYEAKTRQRRVDDPHAFPAGAFPPAPAFVAA